MLQPGKDAWPIEFDLGTVMDGDTEEHIAEVARVLARAGRFDVALTFLPAFDAPADRKALAAAARDAIGDALYGAARDAPASGSARASL